MYRSHTLRGPSIMQPRTGVLAPSTTTGGCTCTLLLMCELYKLLHEMSQQPTHNNSHYVTTVVDV